jgi:hypothetical protein
MGNNYFGEDKDLRVKGLKGSNLVFDNQNDWLNTGLSVSNTFINSLDILWNLMTKTKSHNQIFEEIKIIEKNCNVKSKEIYRNWKEGTLRIDDQEVNNLLLKYMEYNYYNETYNRANKEKS